MLVARRRRRQRSGHGGECRRPQTIGPHRHLPRLPSGARAIGSLAQHTRIQIAVTFRPRDPAALAAYAQAVAAPGSSVFRHYLTVAQFRARFGPTDAHIAEVRSALRARGLTPGAVTPNGLAIPVDATASKLARAFSIGFKRYVLPRGRHAFTNTKAPQFAASVVGIVQGVVGLDSVTLPQPVSLARANGRRPNLAPHIVTGGPQPCSGASGVSGAWTADQIASAYGFSGLYGTNDEGAGQTVAIYELEPNIPSDITAYQSCYGTNASVTYDPVDGGPGSFSTGDGLETELDIEDVIGLAPDAHIIVYQGPTGAARQRPAHTSPTTRSSATTRRR